jgi:hypothetical protein
LGHEEIEVAQLAVIQGVNPRSGRQRFLRVKSQRKTICARDLSGGNAAGGRRNVLESHQL